MSQRVFARYLAPGFAPGETVTQYIDTLLDFAQFYDYSLFQPLAVTLAKIEEAVGNVACKDLPEEPREFLQDLQGEIISFAYDRINESDWFANKAFALARKIREHPEQTSLRSKAIAGDVVHNTFEQMFQEEIEDYFWYNRIVAKIIWRFDNWFGDKIAVLYSSFTEDMVAEVNYWKMARQVSVARAIV